MYTLTGTSSLRVISDLSEHDLLKHVKQGLIGTFIGLQKTSESNVWTNQVAGTK